MAEEHHHHPEINIDYNNVEISLTTKDSGEITEKILFSLKKLIYYLKNVNMEWYMKNRWWIWSVTGVYIAYRLYTSIML